MVELRFILLRLLVDVLFVVVIFFAFMCGIHYGTKMIGLYFWFVKLLLGLVGAGLGIRLTLWAKNSILFMIKNGSIYAQCRDDCNTVLGSFAGITMHFKETISINVLNKLIRDGLDEIQSSIIDGNQDSPLIELMNRFGDIKILKLSKKIIVKSFDYVDECILGYCYSKVDKEHGIIECSVKAFVLFVKNSPKIFGKVISTISLQIIARIGYWVVVVLWAKSHFYFGLDLKVTLLNIVLVYFVAKLISFTLEDAVLEPLLMHGVIQSFCKIEWSSDDEQLEDELGEKIPAFAKLRGMLGKGKSNEDADTVDEAVENVEDAAKEAVDDVAKAAEDAINRAANG